MEYSFLTLILINVIVLLGSLLQGLIGYGIGMFCAPLLFLINPTLVPAPLILLSTFLAVFMLYRDKSHLQFNQVSWAMRGGFVGIILAGMVLKVATKTQFELAFGIVTLAAVFISVLGFSPQVNKKNNVIAGFSSGFMGTLTAIGGPPMALLYQHGGINKIKANLTAFWLFLNIIALITLTFVGELTLTTLTTVVLALPGMLIGLALSSKLQGIVKPHFVRRWVLVLCAITSIVRALA